MGVEAERWATRTDAELRTRGPGDLLVGVSLFDVQATVAALRLYEVDRELRRVVAIGRRQDGAGPLIMRDGKLPRPIPVSRGGLLINEMAPGSLNFLLVATGGVMDILASRPTEALLALSELLGKGAKLQVWLHRRQQRTLQRAQPARDLGLGEPDMTLLGGHEGAPEREPAVLRQFGDDFEAGGRWIRLTRTYPDGTSDVWEVEG
jgi:hypothetical protein